MTEAQYLALCSACDDVLMSGSGAREHLAIPWLHVIREHPATIAPYEWLFESTRPGWRRTTRALRSFASLLGRLCRAATNPRSREPAAGLAKCDVLFVSHLTTPDQVGQRSDAYFGSLPQVLADSGEGVAVALINHTRHASQSASAWAAPLVPRIILPPVMPLGDEVAAARRLMRAFRGLRAIRRRRPEGLPRVVAAYAGAEALSGGAANAMRIGMQIARLVQKLNPRAVVITYEGHAWERVAIDSVRAAAPGVRCVAYQHALLSRLSHAPTRSLGPRHDPDVILTGGDVSRRRLERSPSLDHVPVDIVGSNRGFAFDPDLLAGAGDRPRVCLVLPEGYRSEVLRLFLFSLDVAFSRPDVEFVWRLHPMTPLEDLAKWSSRFRKLPDNISISRSSLVADAARSRWALYRGSTAIVQAVGAGALPVYLSVPGEMTIDPLFEVGEGRPIVETARDFESVLDRQLSGATNELRQYCAAMFAPFRPDVLRRAVAPAGLPTK
jgi:hypothetical protein